MKKSRRCSLIIGIAVAAVILIAVLIGLGTRDREQKLPKETALTKESIEALEKTTNVMISESSSVAVYDKATMTLKDIKVHPTIYGTVDLKKGTAVLSSQDGEKTEKTTLKKEFGLSPKDAENGWELLNYILMKKGCGSLYLPMKKDGTLKDVKDLAVWKNSGLHGDITNKTINVTIKNHVPIGVAVTAQGSTSDTVEIYTMQLALEKNSAVETDEVKSK